MCQHCHQEVQTLKNPHKIHNLDQTHQNTETKKNPHDITDLVTDYVKYSRPEKHNHAGQLQIVPGILPVAFALLFDLHDLINQENSLNEGADTLAKYKLEAFHPPVWRHMD